MMNNNLKYMKSKPWKFDNKINIKLNYSEFQRKEKI